MYNDMFSYCNLTQPPFSKEIQTEDLVKLPSVEANLSSVRLLVETRGIGLLTGKSGSGKDNGVREFGDFQAVFRVIFMREVGLQ